MLFAAVPAVIWLLAHLAAEASSKGNVPAGRLPHGAAELCDKGNMTANTSSHVQPGSSITLSCQLKPQQHSKQCRIAIFFNSSERNSSYSSSVSTRFLVHTYGKHMFTCKILCEYGKKLICGIDIESGNPPDEPRNVSCIQQGTDGHPICTWDKGRLTYINTTYVIQLSNGTDVLYISEESLDTRFGSLALSKLNFDSTYTIVVAASNELGSAFSQPLVFTLIDIVKPHPPKFSVEFEHSSATNCTLSWHDEAQAQHCRLRYRPLTRRGWSMVENLNGEKYSLYALEPYTTYEFQLSCKIHPKRGLWSNWSRYQNRTPEAVPTGVLDVWYRQQDVGSQQQNISLFWKALSKSEARGRILQYTVTFKALDQQSPVAEAHLTTQTSYARVMPRVNYKITVTAENSRGRSPPASVVTDLGIWDLPPPQEVSAIATGNSSILISWKPPISSTASISGYVVEWADTQRNVRLEPRPAWVKLPASNLSTVIAAVSSVTAQRSLYITDLQPGEHYVLWMTASTAAGEGPWGNSELICLENAGEWMAVVLTCSIFIFSACICSMPPARKALHSLLTILIPQWQSKAIPDPANAMWAKEYTSVKAELRWRSSLFLPSTSTFEEPEPTQVEEAFVKPSTPVLQGKALLSSSGSQGHGERALESSRGHEEPRYEALPSTADGQVCEQQLPDLYRRMVVEAAMEHTQNVPEYIANPSTAPPYLPLGAGTAEDLPELECQPLSMFPTTCLLPMFPYEGNLTLDTVKINCSSFTT
ncbi:interleukin-12 receptor subunit beta-2 isoform X3 [Lathamus discolor]|uniref:interleukin-12 receptor subunit beta-2 isoform X3 n=1 Tax=Lathamus discolor TaxID=678569 RepID=UPI0032B6F95A